MHDSIKNLSRIYLELNLMASVERIFIETQ